MDFELRSAEYYSLLAELSGSGPDRDAAEGFLPAGIADRVRALRLDDTFLRVSLRGYQAFGARFALAQKRVIIGDEMGLGKTVQAIAALAHLAAGGETHFLVVLPGERADQLDPRDPGPLHLRAVPVHGTERTEAFADWREAAGVAVTTFDALHLLPGGAAARVRPAMLVVDEAHFVKNAETRRSRAVAGWAEQVEHVLFLTGTPMENRVEEFRSLVRRLRPELAPAVSTTHGAAGRGPSAGPWRPPICAATRRTSSPNSRRWSRWTSGRSSGPRTGRRTARRSPPAGSCGCAGPRTPCPRPPRSWSGCANWSARRGRTV
ncbi:hypothetical protein ID875_30380 [Streptomyces globisporus]|uniref:Helicase ATP-binding domain-containing protein n=1 Tax=Streptomyces globisporus TaxID=1908 RepID=A0A927BMT1_STRGL|nr:hypothetical protein [Streptomyces globisporus]